jgi:hypothetical protein
LPYIFIIGGIGGFMWAIACIPIPGPLGAVNPLLDRAPIPGPAATIPGPEDDDPYRERIAAVDACGFGGGAGAAGVGVRTGAVLEITAGVGAAAAGGAVKAENSEFYVSGEIQQRRFDSCIRDVYIYNAIR